MRIQWLLLRARRSQGLIHPHRLAGFSKQPEISLRPFRDYLDRALNLSNLQLLLLAAHAPPLRALLLDQTLLLHDLLLRGNPTFGHRHRLRNRHPLHRQLLSKVTALLFDLHRLTICVHVRSPIDT